MKEILRKCTVSKIRMETILCASATSLATISPQGSSSVYTYWSRLCGTTVRDTTRWHVKKGLDLFFVHMLCDSSCTSGFGSRPFHGKTFKAAARIIEAVVTHSEVKRHLADLGVQWIFNLPKAPWWGGMFERLIGSTKRCLRKVIEQAKLTYDELLTAVVEAEAVINSRPLTYVSMDDLDEPLTPAHLLIGRRVLSLPDYIRCGCENDVAEVEPELLDKRVRHLNATLNQFWERWRK